jgi:pimeloyl-ACP methyl ester carboxylesterase
VGAAEDVEAWESAGRRVRVGGHDLFVADREPLVEPDGPPILILHGFPTCSYDWRHLLGDLSVRRRVVIPDMLGYGLSPKPDQPYSLFEQADLMAGVARSLELDEVDLVTHDMGDSVGGELLARSIDGALDFDVRRRVLTNGSIYIDMAQLTIGQQLLLGLPDERMPDNPNDGTAFRTGLTGTFPPDAPPSDGELEAQWLLVHRDRGDLLMPRLVRYIEERRVHERRWTGAIESHPSPVRVVWGDLDPVAVWPMAEALAAARPDADVVRLEGIAHLPSIEAPARLAELVLDWFGR